MRAVRPLWLWIISTIIFTLAAVLLELLEGNRIGTTEYYGLRNMGPIFIVMMFLPAALLYPVILWPLTWVARRFVHPLVGRAVILLCSGYGGHVLFDLLYEERWVQEYALNRTSAIVIFLLAGLVYVVVDYYLESSETA